MSEPATAPRPASARALPRTGRLTVGLCIGITAVAFEALAVATAMPRAAEELQAREWYAWAFSVFQAAVLFGVVACGRLCDRIGPVRPMLGGMAVFGLGLVIAGLAVSMPMLIAGRAVQGLGAGAMGVSLYVIIAHYYPPERRARVMSWTSTAWVLPGFVGPVISGWLTEHLSWHWVFGAVIPVLLVAAGLLVPILLRLEASGPPRGDEEPDPAPIWAAALVAVAVPVLQGALQQPGWWSIPMLLLAVVLLGLGLPRLVPAGVWRLRPGIGPVIVVRGLIGGTYFATETFAVLMLVEQHHLDLRLAGLVLTVGTVGWTTGAFVQARWVVRRDLLMTIGTSGIALGVVGVALVALTDTPTYWLVGVAWAVAALGMGIAFASTSVATMRLSGPVEQGRNAASLQLAEALGASLFSGVVGAGYAFGLRTLPDNLPLIFGSLFAGLVVLALVGVVVSRRVGRVAH